MKKNKNKIFWQILIDLLIIWIKSIKWVAHILEIEIYLELILIEIPKEYKIF